MRFQHALAISLAVHAIALFGAWPSLRETLQEPAVPPPLVTRIVELAPPPPPPPERKTQPRPEPRKSETPKPLSPPAPSPVAEPAPAPAPATPETPPVASAPTAPVAPPQVDARAVEAATATQYRMQLIAYAQRNKPPYPRVARENNWTGEVTLEITLRADSQAELGLRRSSGHEVLDRLALDTYQQALRAVPVPAALRGKQVKLDPLRLVYNLTE